MSPPFAIAMAEQAVQEFFKRWFAGLQPSLLLETQSNGDISVSSRVTCGVTLPEQSEQSDWPHSHGHPIVMVLLVSVVKHAVPMERQHQKLLPKQPLPRLLAQLWKLSNPLRLKTQLLLKQVQQLCKLMLVLLNQSMLNKQAIL